MSKIHNVFVYGTLMSGYANNTLLRNSRLVGKAITDNSYVLMARGIPFVAKEGVYWKENKEHATPILGEVYQVDSQDVPSLDMLEGHPSWYRRELVPVTIVNSNGDKFTTDAWLYFNEHEVADVVPSGDYREHTKARELWYEHYRKQNINV